MATDTDAAASATSPAPTSANNEAPKDSSAPPPRMTPMPDTGEVELLCSQCNNLVPLRIAPPTPLPGDRIYRFFCVTCYPDQSTPATRYCCYCCCYCCWLAINRRWCAALSTTIARSRIYRQRPIRPQGAERLGRADRRRDLPASAAALVGGRDARRRLQHAHPLGSPTNVRRPTCDDYNTRWASFSLLPAELSVALLSRSREQ